MQWSKKLPTKSGIYWMDDEIVCIFEGLKELKIQGLCWHGEELLKDMVGKNWFGPIKPPNRTKWTTILTGINENF